MMSYYISTDYWKDLIQRVKISWKFFRDLDVHEHKDILEEKISDIPHFLDHLRIIGILYFHYKTAPDWRIKSDDKKKVLDELEVLLKFSGEDYRLMNDSMINRSREINVEEDEDYSHLVSLAGGSSDIPHREIIEDGLDYQI